MDDITNENKLDNNLPQETIEKINEKPTEENISITESKENAQEDPNWRAFREARKKDRAEKEAAEKRAAEKEAEAAALKAAMEAAFAKSYQYPSQDHSVGAYQEESEDERIEKKVQAIIEAREAKYQREREIREQYEYPQRLSNNYPDFNQVISNENLDYLDYHYPEISRPLKRLSDNYDKWEDIYKAIKKLVPNLNDRIKDAKKAEENFNKPKSISSPSITQSGQPMGSARLTEEKRAANWARMQATLKGVS